MMDTMRIGTMMSTTRQRLGPVRLRSEDQEG